MTHLDDILMLQYISKQASEDERIEVDSHLAECSECLTQVKALAHIRDNFEAVWESWTAAEHGRVLRQWQLAVALEKLGESVPALVQQIKSLFHRLETDAETCVKIWLDRVKILTTVAGRVMPQGHEFHLRPAAAGVGDDNIQSHINRASSFLSQEQVEEAVMALESSAEINVRTPQFAVSEIDGDAGRVAEVIVDSRQGRISVKLWHSSAEAKPSLVLLIPGRNITDTHVAEFEQVEDVEYLLAEFQDVPTGQFDVIW